MQCCCWGSFQDTVPSLVSCTRATCSLSPLWLWFSSACSGLVHAEPSYSPHGCGLFRVDLFWFCLSFAFLLFFQPTKKKDVLWLCASRHGLGLLLMPGHRILESGHPESSIQNTDRTRLSYSLHLSGQIGLGIVARPKDLQKAPILDLTTIVY